MFDPERCEYISRRDKPGTIEELRAAKLAEVSEACRTAIHAGVEVKTSDGKKRFSLEAHDQMELMALKPRLDALIAREDTTTLSIPYQADGELCRLWTADDFGAILQAAAAHIFYHRTYCNHLNAWILRASADELPGIVYGVKLPKHLAGNIKTLVAARGEG